MRIAVLTGLFACTLVFVGSSQSASASEVELLAATTKPIESVSLQLLAVADTTESELLPLDEEIVQSQTNEPEIVEHVVQEDETLTDVAKQHDTTWKRLYDKNDSIEDPDIINPGEVIVVPDEEEEVAERELPVAPEPVAAPVQRSSSVSSRVASVPAPAPTVTRGSNSGNLYAAGNCTWHVKSLRPDLPNNLGNANTWASRAAAQGLATGYEPRVGAAAQFKGRMHVAYVTAVNSDGTVTISEMNYRELYQVTNRVVPASSLIYIY